MAKVPGLIREAKSPLADEAPTPANLLMAAAEMNRLGRLTEPDKNGPGLLKPGRSAKGLPKR